MQFHLVPLSWEDMSNQTMNRASHFTLTYNDGRTEEMDCEDKHHRLYYEFHEFIQMIHHRDFDRERRMQAISVAVLEIIDQARRQEKIFFDNDRKIAINEAI